MSSNAQTLKLEAKKQFVLKTLKRLKLSPSVPISQVLKDETKKSYSSKVTDGRRDFFIKIRISKKRQHREDFYISYTVATLVKKGKLSLFKFTPRLVDGSVEDETDWLLFDHVKGKNMGSRRFHDVFKFKREDVDNLVNLKKAIEQVPSKLFPKAFRKRKGIFFQQLITKEVPFDQARLSKYYSQKELDQIINLAKNKKIASLFDKASNTFQHGDFQAPNFLKTKKGLFIVDFDQACLANKFYDLAVFYTHAFRKPALRDILLDKFVDFKKMSNQDKLLYNFARFAVDFVWVKNFLRKEKWYKMRKLPDFEIREGAFYLRLKDTKNLLKQIEI